jgi:hypothetical protein
MASAPVIYTDEPKFDLPTFKYDIAVLPMEFRNTV